MNGQDIVNFYLNNPPFEITDKYKYIEFLQFQTNMTLIELSENDPIVSEKTIVLSDYIGEEEYIRYNLKDIDDNFLKIILFDEKHKLFDTIESVIPTHLIGRNQFGFLSSGALNSAMRSGSLLNLMAIKDYLPILNEWFVSKSEFIIFDNSFIKIRPNIEYYSLYERGKTINELNRSDMLIFKRLLGINIMLDIYQSDIFASEGGIRSVSLSGLSVSFNVPEGVSKVASLSKQKSDLLNSIAFDYSDGCVGLI